MKAKLNRPNGVIIAVFSNLVVDMDVIHSRKNSVSFKGAHKILYMVNELMVQEGVYIMSMVIPLVVNKASVVLHDSPM